MTSKKEDQEKTNELVKQFLADLKEESQNGVACIILDIPISEDPDDPIRQVIDDVLGDFIEIPTPNGTFFFPLKMAAL